MTDAKEIVKNLLTEFGLDFKPRHVMHLFDDGYELDYPFDTSITYRQGQSSEFEDSYNQQQNKINKFDDALSTRVGRLCLQGGGEGEGEYCYGIIKIDDHYIKADWSYFSYHGCEYFYIIDTLTLVTPKEKTITIYEKI